jgi:hypothetical protein
MPLSLKASRKIEGEGRAPEESKKIKRTPEEKETLREALRIEKRRLSIADWEMQVFAIKDLAKIIPHLAPPDRLAWTQKIEEKLRDESVDVSLQAFKGLRDIIPHLAPQDRLAWTHKIEVWIHQTEENLRDEDHEISWRASEVSRGLIPHLDPGHGFLLACSLEESFGTNMLPKASDSLMESIPSLTLKERFALTLEIGERLIDLTGPVRLEASLVLEKIISTLELRDQLNLLAEIMVRREGKGKSVGLVALLLQRIHPEHLSFFAEKEGRMDLKLLSRYHAAHLPFETYFWEAYLRADDPDHYLKEISHEVREYRRGKMLSRFDVKEMHLAYAGLDSPEELSFQLFQENIIRSSLPPKFLNQTFQASLRIIRSIHDRVDKGKILRALQPREAIEDAETFKKYLMELIQREKGSLKKIKEDLKIAFPKGLVGLEMEEILAGARELLPRIFPKRQAPPVQDLIVHLAFLIAWNRQGMGPLQEKMKAMRGKKIPSDTVWEGLKATEEFYRDTLEDVMKHFGLVGDEIPFLKKQRRWLAAEL